MGHLSLLEIFLFPLPFILCYLWWSSSRTKELAVKYARSACQNHQVQLLDQTVALKKVRLVRTSTGSLGLNRLYQFEFTNSSEFRDNATISMNGQQLQRIYFPFIRDESGNRVYQH